jgi:hypothetical protein
MICLPFESILYGDINVGLKEHLTERETALLICIQKVPG